MAGTKEPHAIAADAKEQHSAKKGAVEHHATKTGATFYETGKRIAQNVMDMQVHPDGMTIGELIRLYRAGELVRVVRCGQCERGAIETEGAIAGYVQCDWCGFGALHPQEWYCGDGVRKEQGEAEREETDHPQSERRNADATPPVNVARMIWDMKNAPSEQRG